MPAPSSLRRSVRIRSSKRSATNSAPSTTQQNGALLSLPIELVERIYNSIKNAQDRRQFAEASRALWLRFGSLWVVDEWKVDWDERGDPYGNMQLFYFSNATHGEDGYAPFFVHSAKLVNGQAVVRAVVPHAGDFTRIAYKGKIYLSKFVYVEDKLYNRRSGEFEFAFKDKQLEMRIADAKFIGERFPCPVCEGSRKAKAKSQKLLEVYPRMSEYTGNPDYVLDCPKCDNDYPDPDKEDAGGYYLIRQYEKGFWGEEAYNHNTDEEDKDDSADE